MPHRLASQRLGKAPVRGAADGTSPPSACLVRRAAADRGFAITVGGSGILTITAMSTDRRVEPPRHTPRLPVDGRRGPPARRRCRARRRGAEDRDDGCLSDVLDRLGGSVQGALVPARYGGALHRRHGREHLAHAGAAGLAHGASTPAPWPRPSRPLQARGQRRTLAPGVPRRAPCGIVLDAADQGG